MSEEKPLDFPALIGELREFAGRVVAFDIRDEHTNLVASGKGPFGHVARKDETWSFQLGGDPPPDREGLRFIVASEMTVYIDPQRVVEAHDIATGIGVPIVLRVRMAGGITVTLWPAMPANEQWTDSHEDNR
jgi:hypothetical protein